MITPEDLAAARHVVYDSGAARRFKEALKNPQGGRKPTFDQSLFLFGMFLAAITHSRTHIRLIHHVLTQEIALDEQYILGIRKPPTEPSGEPWVISEADLQNVSRSIRRALSYTPTFLPRHLAENAAECHRRKTTLEALMDAILDATLVERHPDGLDYAIDDTGLWAPERARRVIEEIETEVVEGDEETTPAPTLEVDLGEEEQDNKPRRRQRRDASDAAFGVKTNKEGKRSWFYGYSLHALVRVPVERENGLRSEPLLAERIRLTPASQDIVDVSLALIDSVRAKGQPIRYLLGDRHYSYKRVERWLYELLKRGISQVVKLRIDDHGFREWDGMLFAAGHAHCPQTPEHLATIKEPGKDADSSDWDEFYANIQKRQHYAAERTLPLTADGGSRWRCPAQAGSLGCPLVPGTVGAAKNLGLPIVHQTPEHPPKICTQKSVGLKITNDEQARLFKVYQKHYWGTRKQVSLANRRTFVEGWFGVLKGDSSARKSRGSSLYRGLAHTSIEAAVFAAASNIINLRSWHNETGLGDPTHPLLAKNHSRVGFVHVTAEEYENHMARKASESAA